MGNRVKPEPERLFETINPIAGSLIASQQMTNPGKMVLSNGAGFAIDYKVVSGSASSSQTLVYTPEQFAAITGHEFTQGRDFIAAQWWNISTNAPVPVSISLSGGTVYVKFSTNKSGSQQLIFFIAWLY